MRACDRIILADWTLRRPVTLGFVSDLSVRLELTLPPSRRVGLLGPSLPDCLAVTRELDLVGIGYGGGRDCTLKALDPTVSRLGDLERECECEPYGNLKFMPWRFQPLEAVLVGT